MTLFEKMKKYYAANFATKETLAGWVRINKKRPGRGLTPEQYKEITGEDYQEEI